MSKNGPLFGIIAMIANAFETKDLVNSLKEAIAEYDEAVLLNKLTNDAEQKIGMYAMMFLAKQSKLSPDEVMEQTDKMEQGMKLLNPEKG